MKLKKWTFMHLVCLVAIFVIAGLPAVADDAALSLRILGSGGPGYNAKRAESSVLIQFGEVRFLVDMGNGTQAGLSETGIRANQLNALFITHHHMDHEQEFIPILAGCLLGAVPPAVVGPAGIKTLAEFTRSYYQADIAYRKSNIGASEAIPVPEVREVKGGEQFSLKGITIRTAAVKHTIETVAYRFEAGGKSIVVSGDLYYSESLIALAMDADILILDGGAVATASQGAKGRPEGQNPKATNADEKGRSHSTLAELISMVVASKVKVVVLTHLSNKAIDEDAVRAAFASAGASCRLVFAKDGLEL